MNTAEAPGKAVQPNFSALLAGRHNDCDLRCVSHRGSCREHDWVFRFDEILHVLAFGHAAVRSLGRAAGWG